MTCFRLLGDTALRSFAGIGIALAVAFPAHAQDAGTPAPPVGTSDTASAAVGTSNTPGDSVQADDAGETIIVTGTRINRPNLNSDAPITTVAGAELFQTGKVSVGDILNELPQLGTSFSQQQTTRFLGTRGLNLADLRNLGTQRTLVLVNGRRHVGGDLLNNAVSTDINTLPTDLIESIDVLTGGGSAVYGSDAIAGAVNFKLKQDFDGVQLRGQSGISQYGDAGNQYVSGLAGANFADGRGNIAVNVEYSHQSEFFASGRKPLRQVDNIVTVDADLAGNSDGTPDRLFLRDIRSTTTSLGGVYSVAGAGACGNDPNVSSYASVAASRYNCVYAFQPDGSLTPVVGTRVGLAPNGSFLGGNGYSGREGDLVALSPRVDRFSANALGHFDISDAFVPFFEAKYVRSIAQGSQSGPLFTNGTILGDIAPGNREQIRLDNPFLSPQARAQIVAARTNAGLASTDATRIILRRTFLDLGIRDERIKRETYRGVLGLRGTFNDDWNYEVSANYGEHREKNRIIGNVNVQRFLLANDTVRNAAGQIVCRSQVDPAARISLVQNDDGSPVDAARLAADVAACVPLNPFGVGSVSQAARDYLTVDSNADGKITQFVGNAFVAGDLSQLFELPGGPIGFVLGGEYRRETVRYDLDETTQQGYAFYNAIPGISAPSFEVKEAFGELNIPILKDTSFFQELTVTGSGRISDYKGSTGTVYSYGGGVVWKPIQDVTFRGSYNRAIRAPNIVELYSAQGQNFLPPPQDPCSTRNLGAGSPTRSANCTAAGRPAGYDFVYTSSLEIISGGNPDLREETSDNYTAGILIQPRFIPGLSLSVDYYSITVNNVINSVDAQTVLNNCYDSATINNPFCASFTRAGAGGGPVGEIPFQVLEGSLLVSSLNYAKLKARGIDTDLSYRHGFGWGTINARINYTRLLERSDFLDPTDESFADRMMSEAGTPRDRLTANADAKIGKLSLGYQLRWIGKQVLGEAENTFSVQGRDPENPDYSDPRFYGNVFYHDIRAAFDVNERFSIYGGVDNLLNRFGPFGSTGIGASTDNVGNTGLFENRGRYFYTGLKANF